jgi:hypothetical protein
MSQALVACLAIALGVDPGVDNEAARDKEALAPLQTYVGGWRGVGQPKRGSSAGAWTEEFEWLWRFKQGRAELVAQFQGGKFYKQLAVRRGAQPREFLAQATAAGDAPDAAPERFRGALVDGALTLTADAPREGRPARISIRLVAGGDRMLVLYEKQAGQDLYARLVEVGSTRKGSSFAKNATSGPECVVTGGLGTIAVTHEGKTYYVCCTGCRDLFLEDPAGVLEEYRQRKAERVKDAK